MHTLHPIRVGGVVCGLQHSCMRQANTERLANRHVRGGGKTHHYTTDMACEMTTEAMTCSGRQLSVKRARNVSVEHNKSIARVE